MKKFISIAVVATATTCVCTPLMSSELYVFGKATQTNVNGSLLSEDIKTSRILGGQITPDVAIELAYSRLGTFSNSSMSSKIETLQASSLASYKVSPQICLLEDFSAVRTSLNTNSPDSDT